MKTIEYKKFSKSIHENNNFSGLPIKGHFELTFRCNLNCNYCYNSCFNNKEHLKDELSFIEICNIIDQIVEAGCLWLTFTGGEPFCRRDFLDIYLYAKEKGLIVTIFTNGTYLKKKVVDYLFKYPPFCIEVTLNAVTKETYEKISGVKGTFDLCMGGIKNAISKDLPVKIKTQVQSLNYSELSLIENYAISLGIEHSFDFAIYPGLDRSKEPCKFRVKKERLKSFFVSKDSLNCDNVSTNDEFSYNDHPIYCASGINSFFIDPKGHLVFCNLIRKPSYDLKEHLFVKSYNKLYPYMRSLTYKSDSKCKRCDLKDSCRRCAGIAFLENSDFESPVEYYCSLASK